MNIIIKEQGQKDKVYEVLFNQGYFTVCKVSYLPLKEGKEASQGELNYKVSKHHLKTYAHFTGLVSKLIEWDVPFEEETLEGELRKEGATVKAKLNKSNKEEK